MELKYLGRNGLFGGTFFEYKLDEACSIYLEASKTKSIAEVKFVVGLPGWKPSMSKEETQAYSLGIFAEISGFNEEYPCDIFMDFPKSRTCFRDFFTDDGAIIKQLLYHEKLYMFDKDAYYEATTDSERVGFDSHETFIDKDKSHGYLPTELISEKEKYAKIFLEIFEYYKKR